MLCACLLAATLSTACEEPPTKEIDQAQGAIDAARAAGAEQYAGTQFSAASAAMTRATTAVAESDYRLALNHALESRAQAQNAARTAAENRARMRGDVERDMAVLASLLAQAEAILAAAPRGPVARQTQREARQTLTEINVPLQETRTAIQGGDYASAQARVQGLMTRAEELLTSLTRTTTSDVQGRSPGPRK